MLIEDNRKEFTHASYQHELLLQVADARTSLNLTAIMVSLTPALVRPDLV